MADRAMTAEPEDEANPFAPPKTDFSKQRVDADPEVEAVRRAMSRKSLT